MDPQSKLPRGLLVVIITVAEYLFEEYCWLRSFKKERRVLWVY